MAIDPSGSAGGENRDIMDDHVQKSCWGLTARAVIGFAGLLLLAWLIGGSGAVTTMAAG
jgi:hypothetical protein